MVQYRVSGPGGPICVIDLDSTASLSDLWMAVEANTGISVQAQQLYHGLRVLRVDSDFTCLQREEGTDHVELLLVQRTAEQIAWLQQLDKARDLEAFFRDAPPRAREDREVILAAVGRSGFALGLAAPELQADREIVLA